ncbi:flagellar hook-length control protein FliK [Neobacillus niacini]|uniref:flagellar hook-length control protein FliK n=1 Tax=Neobacillus niacini TaxID=86668 RepID=UPI003B0197CF
MIQLSGIQMKSINQTGKKAASEGEQAAGFEALLQLIGQVQEQQKEEDTVPFGFINPLVQSASLQQNALTDPILHQVGEGMEKWSIEVQAQVEPNIENGKQTSENLLFQSNIKKLVTVEGQTGEVQPEAATIFQESVTGDLVKETGIVTNEDFHQKELPDVNQTGRNSTVDALTTFHSTLTNQPVVSNEKAVPAQTVQANQFDQEITKFLQSSIHVTGLEDGIEAAFTLAPKHLGKVDVKVTIQEGQVTAEFLTSTPLGKDLLETHVQTLRSALETQGLHVAKIDISQQNINSNFMGAFSQKGDSNARHGQQDSRKRNDQQLIQTQDEYRDYTIETGWVSKINTTA